MATLDDLGNALIRADAAGDTEGAKALAAHIKWLKDPAGGNYQQLKPAAVDTMPAPDPSAGGGTLSLGPIDTAIPTPQWLDRGLAGAGQALTNLGRGAGQLTGLESRADVADSRKLDAPLDKTTAGTVGNIAGNVLATLPALAIPGASTIPGMAAVGGLTGLLQPSTSTGETVANTGLGAAAGPALTGLGRILGGAGVGVGNFAQQFYGSGRDQIVGKTLNRFAGDGAPDAIAAMRAGSTSAVPGFQPTVGGTAGNGGLSQLERAIGSQPGVDNQFTQRGVDNRNAIIDSVKTIAGDDGQRTMYAADRSAAAKQLYGDAFADYDASNLTPALKGQVTQLLKRPSINDASKQAQTLAMERGETPSAEGSLQALHDVKQILDDQISAATQNGLGGQAAALKATQDKLLNVMDQLSPAYREARATYAEMSKPINEMDVGKSLFEKLSPAANEDTLSVKLMSGKLADAMRNGDATAAKATGFPGATMESVLSPDNLARIANARAAAGQLTDAASLGQPAGSNTAKNLITQNTLDSMSGVTKIPGLADSGIAKTIARMGDWLSKSNEPDVQDRLARALLNPSDAADLMSRVKPGTTARQFQSYLEQALSVGVPALGQSSEKQRLQSSFGKQPAHQP